MVESEIKFNSMYNRFERKTPGGKILKIWLIHEAVEAIKFHEKHSSSGQMQTKSF